MQAWLLAGSLSLPSHRGIQENIVKIHVIQVNELMCTQRSLKRNSIMTTLVDHTQRIRQSYEY